MRNVTKNIAVLALALWSFWATPCFGQAWTGILAPSRAVDWTNAGIPGGVPSGSWTQCGSTLSAGASTTTIQTAINNCTSNHYVLFGAGTFTLTAAIHVNASNVELRGSGPTQTTIVLNGFNILLGNGNGNQGSVPGGIGSTTLSTLSQGSTVLTVGSTTGMSVGQVIAITEQAPAWVFPAGISGNQNGGFCLSPLNLFGCSGGSGANSAAEMVQITNVNAGANQITIAAPGLSQTYTSGLVPTVVYWSTTGVYSNDGIKNMKVDAGTSTTSDFAIALVFCHECWAQNVAVINAHRAGIYSLFGYRDEIRDSYVSASNGTGAPTEYGIENDRCTLTKIENNIEFGVTSPIIVETSYGVVEGYNYLLRTATDNQFPVIDTHRAHNYELLAEGNVAANVQFDNTWGSTSHSTTFRSALNGNEPNATNYRIGYNLGAQQRYINAVANVIGDPTHHTQYQCDNNNLLSSDIFEYSLGFWDQCNTIDSFSVTSFTGTSGTLTFTNSGTNGFFALQNVTLAGFTGGNTGLNGQNVIVLAAGLSNTTFEAAVTGSGYASGTGTVGDYDTVVESSLMRWGNWDAVTYCANGGHAGTACGATGSNGIRYCTASGVGNAACTASETANSDPTFPGLASPSTTFPSSFYNGVTGAFPSGGTGLSYWKTPYGTPIYPPIGPDVTCGTNCISNTASHAAMIPAQLCYNNTAQSGGFLTAFDANVCYQADTGTSYLLSLTVSGSGSVSSSPSGISCPSTCGYSFTSGTVVTLTETPILGATFTGWSGAGCSGTGTTCSVTMSAAEAVTASFTSLDAGPCPICVILSFNIPTQLNLQRAAPNKPVHCINVTGTLSALPKTSRKTASPLSGTFQGQCWTQ